MFALRIRRQGQTAITLTRFRAATLTRVISLNCHKLLRISTSKNLFYHEIENCFMALTGNSLISYYVIRCLKEWNRYVFKFRLLETLITLIKKKIRICINIYGLIIRSIWHVIFESFFFFLNFHNRIIIE